jgi:nicotinamidase-related amidase
MSYLTLKRVAIIGVAEDYCVRDAIIGYLKRGFEVTMLDDLTHGIYNPAQDPTGVNDWDELVEKHFADAVKSGQLLTEKSGNYLAKLTAW